MLSLSSVQNIIHAFNGIHEVLEAISEAINSLPPVYANDFPALPRAVSSINIQAYTMHSQELCVVVSSYPRFSDY